jgi:hypothetical protein
MHLTALPPVHLLRIPGAAVINDRLWDQFQTARDAPELRRSHFLHGRYENLYLDRDRTPAIGPLIDAATQAATTILGHPGPLRCGHWFNLMGPGERTSLHTHEEDGELLSAVYYVRTPEHCGDLLLEDPPVTVRVRPEAGLMVLFPPDLPHAVEPNGSTAARLAVAFNFGPAED